MVHIGERPSSSVSVTEVGQVHLCHTCEFFTGTIWCALERDHPVVSQ